MWRRPLTSTKVRLVPRPRRSSTLKPAVPMKRTELDWLKVERSDGRSFSASPMFTSPRLVSSSMLTDVIGTFDSRFGRRMRDPVTTIWSFVLVGELTLVPDLVSTSPEMQLSRLVADVPASLGVVLVGQGGGWVSLVPPCA